MRLYLLYECMDNFFYLQLKQTWLFNFSDINYLHTKACHDCNIGVVFYDNEKKTILTIYLNNNL